MKTIGIIGAMPSELADIRNTLTDTAIEKYADYDFYINNVNNKKIINVCCGVAKVNSAIASQILIDIFKVDCIINTGIAGGMNSKVKVCDIVIASEVMHHDVTTRFLQNYPPYSGNFKTDKKLTDLAKESCEINNYTSFIGKIVSGEQFISDNDIKERICLEFSPLAVDMESASIGHVCFRNSIPFVNVRCISDNADDAGELSFEEFEKIAAKRNAEVVLTMINKL